MKPSLTFSGWFFVGLLLLIGFTSGLSATLRRKDAAPHAHDVDLVTSWSILQERQRNLRPKAAKSQKNKGSKKNNDMGITTSSTTTSKKSSKKGAKTDVIISPPATNDVGTNAAVVTPAAEPSVPATNRTYVPPATNNSTVPTNGKKDALQPCKDHDECLNNACGFENLESSASGQKVCCLSGASYLWSYPLGASLYFFCTQPLGAACSEDDGLCISGTCAGVVCVDGLQPDGGSCDKPGECTSGQCARERVEETSPMVCCPQGVGTSLVFVLYNPYENMACANQPTGARCTTPFGADNNDVCASKKCVNNKCA